jgi:hypothetical protein
VVPCYCDELKFYQQFIKSTRMALDKHLALKIFGLAIGCAAKFTTGSLFVFNVYQDAIKDTFNYTQKEGKIYTYPRNMYIHISKP